MNSKQMFITTLMVASMTMLSALPLGYQHAQSTGRSGCPDPGHCTCNAATGVMTDHAMAPPFNRINNGCTESGRF
jgi:hypothetical protein